MYLYLYAVWSMESFISYLTFSAAPTTAHVRTDLSHNSQEGLLTSSAEQVQRLRSTTQPLALDPPRKLSTKLDATTRNRYERNRYDEDLVQWAPLWANGLLARLSPSQLAHLRSISGDPKPSSEVIRGHQRSSGDPKPSSHAPGRSAALGAALGLGAEARRARLIHTSLIHEPRLGEDRRRGLE